MDVRPAVAVSPFYHLLAQGGLAAPVRLEFKMHVDSWIQLVTAIVGAVTSWIQLSV